MHALNIEGSGFNKKENNDLYLYNPEKVAKIKINNL